MSTLNFPLNYTYNVTVYDTVTTIPDGLQSVQKFYQYGGKYIAPLFDTSKVTNMSNMFYDCKELANIPLFDTSKVTDMSYFLYNTYKIRAIPQLDTSSVTNMNSMFYSSYIVTIPELDCSSVTTFQNMFNSSGNDKLVNVGGFKNLGMQSTCTPGSYFMRYSQYLTHESMLNIVNGLYDRASAGYSVVKLTFHANALALLSDEEKAIATNKGWTLA